MTYSFSYLILQNVKFGIHTYVRFVYVRTYVVTFVRSFLSIKWCPKTFISWFRTPKSGIIVQNVQSYKYESCQHFRHFALPYELNFSHLSNKVLESRVKGELHLSLKGLNTFLRWTPKGISYVNHEYTVSLIVQYRNSTTCSVVDYMAVDRMLMMTEQKPIQNNVQFIWTLEEISMEFVKRNYYYIILVVILYRFTYTDWCPKAHFQREARKFITPWFWNQFQK